MILIPFSGLGQLSSTMENPSEVENYYQFPIRTGSQNFLSGTMGELRSSHFHAGIDIKTQGTQGLEVYAAADGYVSRIKVATGGYGNALYLLHPNGTTSVYAHLKNYNQSIADHVRKAQYQNKSFEVELYPDKSQFPVKKGQVIGYSGTVVLLVDHTSTSKSETASKDQLIRLNTGFRKYAIILHRKCEGLLFEL